MDLNMHADKEPVLIFPKQQVGFCSDAQWHFQSRAEAAEPWFVVADEEDNDMLSCLR